VAGILLHPITPLKFGSVLCIDSNRQCHKDTEVKFVDCYWPEFTVWRFIAVLLDYQVGLFRKSAVKDD